METSCMCHALVFISKQLQKNYLYVRRDDPISKNLIVSDRKHFDSADYW